MPKLTEGPFVQAACFCDNVIEGKDGVLSLIRLIDTLHHPEAGPNPPMEMPEFNYTFMMVIMLKAGQAKGRNEIRVAPELPNGSSETPMSFTVHFDGEEKGQNIIIRVSFRFKLEGLYWFDVYLGDEKITSMPLRVKYERIIVGTTPM